MYHNRVGVNSVLPVGDKQDLSEEHVQVAAVKFISGASNPLESDSDREVSTKDTPKTRSARRRAFRAVHTKKEMKTEVASPMNMYLRIKQMSLFPSIY